MSRIRIALYSTLFVLSYAGSLLYFIEVDTGQSRRASGMSAAGAGISVATRSPGIPVVSSNAGNPSTVLRSSSKVTQRPPTSDAVEPEDAQRIQQLNADAIRNADPEQRAAAIQQLGGASSHDSIYALGQAAALDEELSNRYLAIASLRLVAANNGDRDGSVRTLLRVAMHDSDTNLARRASETFHEVEEIVAQP